MRTKNYTEVEKTTLIEIIAKYADIIESKKTDGQNNKSKYEAWSKIAEEFNSLTLNTRSVDSLRTFYKNLKRSTRKCVAIENKEHYVHLLHERLDHGVEEGKEDEDLAIMLSELDKEEKKEIKKTGGGKYKTILPVGAEAVMGEILAEQIRPLENPFDDGSIYFGDPKPSTSQTVPAISPKRRPSRKRPLKQQTSSTFSLKKRLYIKNLTKVNMEIRHQQALFSRDLKIKDLEIRKLELEIQKLKKQ